MSKASKKDTVTRTPLTETEKDFNQKVETEIVGPLRAVSMIIEKRLKPLTLDVPGNAKTIYGPNSANKTDVNKLVSLINSAISEFEKIRIAEESSKGDNGYAMMHYMAREIAPMIGLAEGTPLWPAGSYPVLSIGILTAWTSIYVYLNDLKIDSPGKRKTFRCDPYMRQFIEGPAANIIDAKGNKVAPPDLNEMNWYRLQMIYKVFIIRDKDGKIVPLDIPEGSPLKKACENLSKFYADLKAQKDELKKKKARIENAEVDLRKAQADFSAGAISQELVNKNVHLLESAKADYESAAHQFVETAASMGIVKH